MSIALNNQTDLRPRIGLGVSSFALGAISTLSFMLLAGYASVIYDAGRATPAFNTMIGEGMVLVWIINLIGIGLGIAGFVQRSSKKTFPILGLALNFGILTLMGAIVAVGLRMP